MNVWICVRSSEVMLPVFVVALEDPCLLGLDYLIRAGACVDLERKWMRVNEEELPLIPGDAPVEVVSIRRVYLAPRSEMRVFCSLSHLMERSAELVKAGRHLGLAEGVTVARSLVEAGEQVTVLVANFSNKTCTIPAGTHLGTCEVVTPGEGAQEDKVAGGPLPEHLIDLAQRSAVHLTREQQTKMQDTLSEFARAFSKGDLDIGRTVLVKHHVKTATIPPSSMPPVVLHQPGVIAPARCEEMQLAVRELEAQGVVEKLDSPWSSAVVLVTEKDGSQLFYVDYRGLNNLTVNDSYPLLPIDDTLDAVTGAR